MEDANRRRAKRWEADRVFWLGKKTFTVVCGQVHFPMTESPVGAERRKRSLRWFLRSWRMKPRSARGWRFLRRRHSVILAAGLRACRHAIAARARPAPDGNDTDGRDMGSGAEPPFRRLSNVQG